MIFQIHGKSTEPTRYRTNSIQGRFKLCSLSSYILPPETHQSDGIEEVLVEFHEMHLPDRSQGLLLGQLAGLRRQAQAVASDPHSTAGDYDYMVACVS